MKQKVLILFNDSSKRKKSEGHSKKIREFFQENSDLFSSRFYYLTKNDFDEQKTRIFNTLNQENPDFILVAGGDGMFRKIAEMIRNKEIFIPLSFYPYEKTSVLRKILGVTEDLSYLKNPEIKNYFPGKITQNKQKHIFFVALTIGSVAKASLEAKIYQKNILGRVVYIINTIMNVLFINLKKHLFEIQVKGEKKIYRIHNALFITNDFLEWFLSGLVNKKKRRITPVIFSQKSKIGVIKKIIKILISKKIPPEMKINTEKKFCLHIKNPTAIYLDGEKKELIDKTDIQFSIVDRPFRILGSC